MVPATRRCGPTNSMISDRSSPPAPSGRNPLAVVSHSDIGLLPFDRGESRPDSKAGCAAPGLHLVEQAELPATRSKGALRPQFGSPPRLARRGLPPAPVRLTGRSEEATAEIQA